MKYLLLLLTGACGLDLTPEPPPPPPPPVPTVCPMIISWDVPDAEQLKVLTGYRLHIGSTTRDYPTAIDLPMQHEHTQDFVCGETYYIALTAVTKTEESIFSDEVEFTAELNKEPQTISITP